MKGNISNLILFDRFFAPLYWLCSQILPVFLVSTPRNARKIVVKFFGIGSLVRLASVLKESDVRLEEIELITLSKNKMACELLGIQAKYIRSNHLILAFWDSIATVVYVWKSKAGQVVDLERTSNLSGLFRLICSLGKSCASFTFETENKVKRGQHFVSLNDKPSIQAIAEILHLEKKKSLANTRVARGKTIVVNVNAGEYLPQRKYPIGSFADAIQQLHQKDPSLFFVLTGLEKEKAYTRQLAKLLGERNIPYQNLTGRLSLLGLVDTLQECRILITNDSGPLHLAYYFEVPTLAIWGPTSPRLVGYPDSDRMLNLSLAKECSPCFIHPKSKVGKACSNRIDCLQDLEAEKVADSAFQLAQFHC